uniref:uncharacterized protein LOC109952523 isoform X2 n=1 Tax=Monopterus albus TaxID=43700 RepID=UPI0009B4AB54|nr:uncharacterized protein LOC109952523 isoform X2 [Monopterus albus]
MAEYTNDRRKETSGLKSCHTGVWFLFGWRKFRFITGSPLEHGPDAPCAAGGRGAAAPAGAGGQEGGNGGETSQDEREGQSSEREERERTAAADLRQAGACQVKLFFLNAALTPVEAGSSVRSCGPWRAGATSSR